MIIFCHVLFPSNGTAPLQDLEKLYASSETLLWKEAMSMSSTSLGAGCRLECTRTADLMGPVGSVASGPFCQRLCSKTAETSHTQLVETWSSALYIARSWQKKP